MDNEEDKVMDALLATGWWIVQSRVVCKDKNLDTWKRTAIFRHEDDARAFMDAYSDFSQHRLVPPVSEGTVTQTVNEWANSDHPLWAAIEPGDGQDVKPAYSSRDYEEFCEAHKEKGLQEKYWKDLPKMWEKELEFRADLEDALKVFSNGL